LVEALNCHRGKGQQKVTVEHLHVHSGGQPVVGVVREAGITRNRRINPMPGKLPMHLMRCADKARQPVPTSSNGELPLQDDGGTNPDAPKGNRNALMHGRSTAEAIASRSAHSRHARSGLHCRGAELSEAA
jgi:hypothetical protein